MLLTPDNFLIRPYRILNLAEAKDFPQWLENTERKLMLQIFGKDQAELLWEHHNQSQQDEMVDELIEKLSGALTAAVYSEWIVVNNYKLTTIGYVENTQPNSTIIPAEEFVVHAWNDYVIALCDMRNTFTEFKFNIPPLKNRYSL